VSLIPEDCGLDRKLLGRLLRAAREEELLTVREVAKNSDLDYSHISKIELGNTAVSLEKFARLCYTLMVPPGLVLESCVFVNRAIYEAGFFNDVSVKNRASDEQMNDPLLRKEISDFLAGTALALSYTLKSSNPLLMLEHLNFAIAEQRDDFKRFANQRVAQLSPAKRRAILRATITNGWDFLKKLGLVQDAYVEAYLSNSFQGKRPWIPLPKAPFFQHETEHIDPLKTDVMLLLSSVKRKRKLADVSRRKLKVDNVAASVMVPGVSSEIPTWKQIVAALKRLTKSSGAKAQLAKELKTSRQNVNKWLSGTGAPSAKLTLEVFRWVEDRGGWEQK
jgi:transcriptional regulator with XRE-family HTH domain